MKWFLKSKIALYISICVIWRKTRLKMVFLFEKVHHNWKIFLFQRNIGSPRISAGFSAGIGSGTGRRLLSSTGTGKSFNQRRRRGWVRGEKALPRRDMKANFSSLSQHHSFSPFFPRGTGYPRIGIETETTFLPSMGG